MFSIHEGCRIQRVLPRLAFEPEVPPESHGIGAEQPGSVRPRRKDGEIERLLLKIDRPFFLANERFPLRFHESGELFPCRFKLCVFPNLLVLSKRLPVSVQSSSLAEFWGCFCLVEVSSGCFFAAVVVEDETAGGADGDLCAALALIGEVLSLVEQTDSLAPFPQLWAAHRFLHPVIKICGDCDDRVRDELRV